MCLDRVICISCASAESDCRFSSSMSTRASKWRLQSAPCTPAPTHLYRVSCSAHNNCGPDSSRADLRASRWDQPHSPPIDGATCFRFAIPLSTSLSVSRTSSSKASRSSSSIAAVMSNPATSESVVTFSSYSAGFVVQSQLSTVVPACDPSPRKLR